MKCSLCGALRHSADQCERLKHMPCETPPHHGVYQGPLKVRVIAQGVAGQPFDSYGLSAEKGRQAQSRFARLKRVGLMNRGQRLEKRKGKR